MTDDIIMQALSYPLETGQVVPPPDARCLIINPSAAPGPGFPANLSVWQWWRGAALSCIAAGLQVSGDRPGGSFDLVFLSLPKQRAEGLGLITDACGLLARGGLLVVAAANDGGGRRLEADMGACFNAIQSASKHKCRIVWTCRRDMRGNLPDWSAGAGLQRHPVSGFWTQPGLFSWDRLDAATARLIMHLPRGETGVFVDAGCGYGALSLELLSGNPAMTRLLCFDADRRALAACEKNVALSGGMAGVSFLWEDFSQPSQDIPADWVVMNPPFHQGQQESIALGQSFIARAAAMLRPGGRLLMVANAHLPYESALASRFKTIEKLEESGGFKIFRCSA